MCKSKSQCFSLQWQSRLWAWPTSIVWQVVCTRPRNKITFAWLFWPVVACWCRVAAHLGCAMARSGLLCGWTLWTGLQETEQAKLFGHGSTLVFESGVNLKRIEAANCGDDDDDGSPAKRKAFLEMKNERKWKQIDIKRWQRIEPFHFYLPHPNIYYYGKEN